MGKYLFLLLFPVISFAQQVEMSIKPEKMSSFKSVVVTNEGYYLIGEAPDKLWLIKTDFNGNINWQRTVFGYNIIDLKAKPNGDVIVISSDYECGIPYNGVENVKMVIYNQSGNLSFEKALFFAFWGADDFTELYTKTTKGTTGEDWRLLFNGDSIYKVSDAGEISLRLSSPDTWNLNILYAYLDSQGKIIVSAEDYSPEGYVYIADNSGEFITYFMPYTSNGGMKILNIKETSDGTHIILGSDGSLNVIDVTDNLNSSYYIIESGVQHFQIIDSVIYAFGYGWFSIPNINSSENEIIDLPDEIDLVKSIYKRNDTLFLAGNKNDKAAILSLDTQLNVLNSLPIPYININDCIWSDSLILLAGEETYLAALNNQNNLVNLPSALFKSFDYEFNTLVSEHDVTILSCSIDTSYVTWTPNYDIVSTKLDVTLSNSGQVELNSTEVSIHYETKLYDNSCDYNVKLYQLSDLHLAPGADTVITVGPVSFSTYGNDSINFTTCAYVYSPNERMDENHNDNKCCTNNSLSLGINESQMIVVNVYPSPTNDIINVELSQDIREGQIRVETISGQIIYALPFDYAQGDKFAIDVSGFAHGLYLLTIENREQQTTVKVVVQH